MTTQLMKDLTKEELKVLIDNNRDLEDQITQLVYEEHMEQQQFEAEEMGIDEAFNIYSHYTSFYLRAKSVEEVAHNIKDVDYMTPQNEKIYSQLKDKMQKWENMTTDEQDENSSLYDEMEELANELADGLTDQLVQWEAVGYEEMLDTLDYVAHEGYMMNYKTDGEKIYYTIEKVMK